MFSNCLEHRRLAKRLNAVKRKTEINEPIGPAKINI